MLGSGIPVVCAEYPAIVELLVDHERGLLFRLDEYLPDQSFSYHADFGLAPRDPKQGRESLPSLLDCLQSLFCQSTGDEMLRNLTENVLRHCNLESWEQTWQRAVLPKLSVSIPNNSFLTFPLVLVLPLLFIFVHLMWAFT